jgi:apolipoprotein N-acyltransferase
MRTVPLVLTLISAGLYAASFPPLSLSLLAWVALVPLFVAAAWVPPGPAALCGLLWGVVAAYGVSWWLPAMVSQYLQISPVLGWVSFFAVSVSLAGVYFGSFAAWLSWIVRRQGANPLLVERVRRAGCVDRT